MIQSYSTINYSRFTFYSFTDMSGVAHLEMEDEETEKNGSGHRNLGNGHNQESALQLFVNAKKKINDIFRNIGDYVKESDTFVQGVSIYYDKFKCIKFVSLQIMKFLKSCLSFYNPPTFYPLRTALICLFGWFLNVLVCN